MRPFTSQEIRGTYATLLLPIREDDSIDFGILRSELEYLTDAGVDGIYSNGTAGEFYTESEDEFVRVNQMLAEHCERASVPFQVGASFPTAQLSLQRITRAVQFRPSAIQVVLPDWWPPTLEESLNFLERAAETAGDIPLVIYNPPHSKRVLTPLEFAIVCDRIPSVVGIKTAGGNDEWYEAMRPLADRLSIFVPGSSLATGFARGAVGAYSDVACLQPRGAARWYCLMKTDLAKAIEQEKQIKHFLIEAILPFRTKQGRSNMALDKILAWTGNWVDMPARLRWPYIGIAPNEASGLRERARIELPFLFD